MKSLRNLLGGTADLATIPPPNPSFVGWRRFLDDAIEAGAIIVEGDKNGDATRYSGHLGHALARRVSWLANALKRGIPYQEASDAFDAAVDRERAAQQRATASQDKRRASTIQEAADEKRATRRPARRASDGYSPDNSWRDEMSAFAEDAGL